MTPPLDLRKLKHFVQVAELKSFTRAAAISRTAQSAISRQIRELEAEFGERLFHRTGHGAILTDFGQDLMPRAKALLSQAEQLTNDIAARQTVPAGDVSLAVLASLGPVFLTPLLDRIRHQFPAIRMRIVEGLAHHVEEWLTNGRVDIGILYETQHYRYPPGEVLFTPSMYLVSHPEDPRIPDGPVPLRRIAELPMILPASPNYHRSGIERICQMHDVSLQVTFEMDSTSSMVELVALGGVYSILPLHAVIRQVEAGQVRANQIVAPNITRRVILATPRQHPVNRATAEVLNLVRDQARALTEWLDRADPVGRA